MGADKWRLQERPLHPGGWLTSALDLPAPDIVSPAWVPALQGDTLQEREWPCWEPRRENVAEDSNKRLGTEDKEPVILRRG